ncbi:LCP family protein [Demequina capsici]|uniref:LCP family protein n=1 Tax=Demequina capsici TaxID=3075620 RepID=A0AA96FCT4_9MICO|nr:LCP family protein [Demequina sp. PMTSA13]WNM28506.1 LCP family protein [Demequina sp. PMTSA13]
MTPGSGRRPTTPSTPHRQRPDVVAPAAAGDTRAPAQAPRRSASAAPVPPRSTAAGESRPVATTARPRRKRHLLRNSVIALLLIVVLVVGGTWRWVESRLIHVDALSGAADTPGETYLIVGSDSRDGWLDDGTEGARTDTIMLLHKPVNGQVALLSIPRDSWVDIPGNGSGKINASFAWGGAPLLVQTVEQLTGLTIDHYVEVGFTGVVDIVDAVGGVELCYDSDVNDEKSELNWTAGCHVADGATALAFSRMRYSDPLGDIGRTQRQQQVMSAVASAILSPSILLNPFAAHRVADVGLNAFRVDDDTHALDLAQAALTFHSAIGGDAVTGTPPISTIDYRVDGQSAVLLDADQAPEFWQQIMNGEIAAGTQVGGLP